MERATGEATNDVVKEVLEKAGGLENKPERERRGRSRSHARESTGGGGGVGGDHGRAAGPQRRQWLELLLRGDARGTKNNSSNNYSRSNGSSGDRKHAIRGWSLSRPCNAAGTPTVDHGNKTHHHRGATTTTVIVKGGMNPSKSQFDD